MSCGTRLVLDDSELIITKDICGIRHKHATMNRSAHYATDHLLAKCLVYIAYLIVGVVSIETANPYVALVFGTAVWLFGVNTAAYLIESLRGHEHCHKLI